MAAPQSTTSNAAAAIKPADDSDDDSIHSIDYFSSDSDDGTRY